MSQHCHEKKKIKQTNVSKKESFKENIYQPNPKIIKKIDIYPPCVEVRGRRKSKCLRLYHGPYNLLHRVFLINFTNKKETTNQK